MEKWQQFWEDVGQEIEQKFNQGPLSTWDAPMIKDFQVKFEAILKPLIKVDEKLANACGVVSERNNWEALSRSTFQRIFRSKTSLGKTSTRNAFAIYLGYRSAEDFIQREINHEPPLLANTIQKLQNGQQEPVVVVMDLPNADFEKEANVNEWMIYELAFLWHGKEPPGIQAHFHAMTRDIEKTKIELHRAVENGMLKARTEVSAGGITRYVTREDLEIYFCNTKASRPRFLNF